MWDTIFFVINYINQPHKKGELNYLIRSRLNKGENNKVLFYNLFPALTKCPYKDLYRPWALLKYDSEGVFLVKKMVEKFDPWLSFGIQEPLYNLNYVENKDTDFDDIFIIIYKYKDKQDSLFELIDKYNSTIIDGEICLKKKCNLCNDNILWLIIDKSIKGFELANLLNKILYPMITIKKFKRLYRYNIPASFFQIDKWNSVAINRLGTQLFKF